MKINRDNATKKAKIITTKTINGISQKIRIELPAIDQDDNNAIAAKDIKIYYDQTDTEIEDADYPIEFGFDISYKRDCSGDRDKIIYNDKQKITIKLEVPLAGDAMKKEELDKAIKETVNTGLISTEIKRQLEASKDITANCHSGIEATGYDDNDRQELKNLITRLP
jgi:hypothetical protein